MKTKTVRNNFFDDLKPEYEVLVNMSVEISNRIEEILKTKGITQKECAELLDKSESEISKWMSGMHNFTLKSIARIETVLGDKVIKVCAVRNLNNTEKRKLVLKRVSVNSIKPDPRKVFTVTSAKRKNSRSKPALSRLQK